jgi:hypothetical protein
VYSSLSHARNSAAAAVPSTDLRLWTARLMTQHLFQDVTPPQLRETL